MIPRKILLCKYIDCIYQRKEYFNNNIANYSLSKLTLKGSCMNKKILFFTVLCFFSATFTSEENAVQDINNMSSDFSKLITSVETTVAAIEKVENDIAADATITAEEVATQNIVTTEEVSTAVGFIETIMVESVETVEAVETAFIPMRFTLSFKVTSGAITSTADFDATATAMRELIEAGHRSSSSLYPNLLTFIKDLQAAIIAGLNLFGIATTTEEAIINGIATIAETAIENEIQSDSETLTATTIAEDILSAAISTELPQILTTDTNSTKSIAENAADNITIAYSIVVDKIENIALWESVKTEMIELANALNTHTKSPAEIVDMFETIIKDAEPLHHSVGTLGAFTSTQE